jgi:hypothetical protein
VPFAKLPNAEDAIIDHRKLVDYLLSDVHPTGRAKAAFFREFGFSRDAPEILESALRAHALHLSWLADIQLTEYGVKFVIDGMLLAPDGRHPEIRAVWFVPNGEIRPHFVTAYPSK